MKNAVVIVQSGPDAARASAVTALLEQHGTARTTLLAPGEVSEQVLAGASVVLIGEACGLEKTASLLEGWVRAGGALVAFANASACEDAGYSNMLGMRCGGVSPLAPFHVNISDPAHEIVRGMSDCRVTDRFLFLRPCGDADLHWLLSGNWQGELLPLAYAREHGSGRVFYTALGTEPVTYTHPAFVRLLHRSIWWATRSTKPGPVRCGLVGYGGAFSMGKHHAEAIRKTRGIELTAICEIDASRLELARTEHPTAAAFGDATQMAKSGLVDVAVVVTPHNTHAPLATTLLGEGVGVICEKPFCLTVDEATRMIELARERTLLLSVFHNRRWDADYLTIRQIIRRGLLGDVFHIEAYRGEYQHPGYWWRSDKTVSGGSMYDWGAHFVDWILNLMPHRMESVTGFLDKRVWHDVSNEDHCRAIIRFAGGRSAELEISHLAAVGKPKWRILGTHGGLTAGWDSPAYVTTHVNGASSEKIEVPYVRGGGAVEYYNNIVDHLLGGEPLLVTPESARRVIAVMELAEKSSRSGQAEAVPFE